jgi:UPF0755 protein
MLQLVSVIVSFAVLAGIGFFIHIATPVSTEENWKEVEIPEGASYKRGINILINNDIVKNKLALFLLGKVTSSDRQLKAGFYYLSASMTPLQIFNNLIKGRTIQYSITIPEGSNLKQIRRAFEDTDLIDEESWQLVYNEDFLCYLGVDAPSLEGYLYPDTYNFPKGTEPMFIFKIMVKRLKKSFNEPLRKRAEELGMTENEVLTIASIIEKEAIHDFERPIISAVYHNRLKRNMRLQADPTVLYGIKKRWKRIRYRDLKRPTPYNTYVIKGLPPGPIASPGERSIKAALYPADVDYLFFVSKNNGTHYFSKTNKEHAKAVIHYQLNGIRKGRYSEKKIN